MGFSAGAREGNRGLCARMHGTFPLQSGLANRPCECGANVFRPAIVFSILLPTLLLLANSRGADTSEKEYFPPPESKGGWRKLNSAADVRSIAGMDSEKLSALKEWLLKSDDRDFAAVV